MVKVLTQVKDDELIVDSYDSEYRSPCLAIVICMVIMLVAISLAVLIIGPW